MMYYYGNGMGLGYGLFGMLAHLLSWVLIIWPICWVIRSFKHDRKGMWPHDRHTSALDILKERYAKGEISSEEYEERKKILEK